MVGRLARSPSRTDTNSTPESASARPVTGVDGIIQAVEPPRYLISPQARGWYLAWGSGTMKIGGEKKAVQNPFARYAVEAGWTYLSPEEALNLRRGLTSPILDSVLVEVGDVMALLQTRARLYLSERPA